MNLHETAMGQRFFNVQLPALINTLKDIAAALSLPCTICYILSGRPTLSHFALLWRI